MIRTALSGMVFMFGLVSMFVIIVLGGAVGWGLFHNEIGAVGGVFVGFILGGGVMAVFHSWAWKL